MEILAEALLHLTAWFIQALLEGLLYLLLEGATDIAIRKWIRLRGRRPFGPVLAGLGYSIIALLAGWLSLMVFPHSFIEYEPLRWLNLLLMPLLAGLLMGRLGGMRRKRHQDAIRLESFGYGFLFAFVMALTRFIGAS